MARVMRCVSEAQSVAVRLTRARTLQNSADGHFWGPVDLCAKISGVVRATRIVFTEWGHHDNMIRIGSIMLRFFSGSVLHALLVRDLAQGERHG